MHEHTAAGQNVGNSLTATDADNDPLIFTLEGTDAASFNLVTLPDSARIQTLAALDHETKNSYSVTVKVDDGHGGTDTVTVTIERLGRGRAAGPARGALGVLGRRQHHQPVGDLDRAGEHLDGRPSTTTTCSTGKAPPGTGPTAPRTSPAPAPRS